jgi:Tfp pilus assembly protein PilN
LKTIHLNLAARPYRDYTAVYAVAALLAVTSLVLMIYNVETVSRYLVSTRHTRATIAATEADIAREQQAADAVRQSLNQVDTATLNEEARYINAQLAERAFSWSALLDQLERVFPQDVRLTQLSPSVDKNRKATLQMSCVSKSPDGMVRLINRLVADPHFRRPFPRTESISNDEYQFIITADYIPDAVGLHQ